MFFGLNIIVSVLEELHFNIVINIHKVLYSTTLCMTCQYGVVHTVGSEYDDHAANKIPSCSLSGYSLDVMFI